MKRSEFKKILKECLLEILTEEPEVKQVFKEAVSNKSTIKPPAKTNINSKQIAKQIAGFDEDDFVSENPKLMEHINIMAADASGGNKKQAMLMQSIFADTALNTLPMQQEGVNGQANMDSPGVELDSLFVDGDVSRWASVAFSKK